MVCRKCGNKINDSQKFCGNCGTVIELMPESVQVNQQVSEIDNKEYELAKKAKSGFYLGLGSIIAWLLPLVGYPITICGMICSIKGFNSKTQSNKATAGFILSVIFLILTVINSILGAIFNTKHYL